MPQKPKPRPPKPPAPPPAEPLSQSDTLPRPLINASSRFNARSSSSDEAVSRRVRARRPRKFVTVPFAWLVFAWLTGRLSADFGWLDAAGGREILLTPENLKNYLPASQ